MIELLSVSHSVLRDQGFATRVISVGQLSGLAFEDDTVLGFVYAFDGPVEMLEHWQDVEKSFLQSNATRFRAANEKAWNIYSVFLTSENADVENKRRIRWIEEDLRFTRKLTGCGLTTRHELLNVLLPLVSLQQKPFLQGDAFRTRLQRRLQTVAGRAADALLNNAVTPQEAARLLRDIRES